MNWQSVLSGIGGTVLNTILPGLAGLVGGRMGERAAETVGGILAEHLGVEAKPEAVANAPRADVEAAVQAIKASPESLAALAALMVEETKQLQAQLADVQDARAAEVARLTTGSATAWTPSILSVLAFAGFGAVTFAILGVKLDANAKEMALFLAGQWSGFVFLSFQYFFGSSPGSKSKDATISAMISKRMGG